MERDYWLGRWQRGETGWHQDEVEPALVSFFSGFPKGATVFVPLCGKSRDLQWLAAHGFRVIGVELSALACEDFFRENEIVFEKSELGAFTVYQGGGVTLCCGDFFQFETATLAPRIEAVYDRAALIALPPELRSRYAARMGELLKSAADPGRLEFLQLLLQRTPADTQGPPFSVERQELERLYGKFFSITELSREKLGGKYSSSERTVEECAYRLTLLNAPR